MEVGAIVGIVLAALVVFIALIIAAFYVLKNIRIKDKDSKKESIEDGSATSKDPVSKNVQFKTLDEVDYKALQELDDARKQEEEAERQRQEDKKKQEEEKRKQEEEKRKQEEEKRKQEEEEKRKQEEKRNNAAKIIQSAERKRQEEKRKQEEEKRSKAATKIQNAVRKRQEEKRKQEEEKRNKAATKIQNAVKKRQEAKKQADAIKKKVEDFKKRKEKCKDRIYNAKEDKDLFTEGLDRHKAKLQVNEEELHKVCSDRTIKGPLFQSMRGISAISSSTVFNNYQDFCKYFDRVMVNPYSVNKYNILSRKVSFTVLKGILEVKDNIELLRYFLKEGNPARSQLTKEEVEKIFHELFSRDIIKRKFFDEAKKVINESKDEFSDIEDEWMNQIASDFFMRFIINFEIAFCILVDKERDMIKNNIENIRKQYNDRGNRIYTNCAKDNEDLIEEEHKNRVKGIEELGKLVKLVDNIDSLNIEIISDEKFIQEAIVNNKSESDTLEQLEKFDRGEIPKVEFEVEDGGVISITREDMDKAKGII